MGGGGVAAALMVVVVVVVMVVVTVALMMVVVVVLVMVVVVAVGILCGRINRNVSAEKILNLLKKIVRMLKEDVCRNIGEYFVSVASTPE
jgi:hypothetical protein